MREVRTVNGTPMPMRAIPMHGGADMYLDMSKLTIKQREDLQAELKKQQFYTQYLFREDPTRILVEAEIRRRLEAEQEVTR
jgi:hypothetical protein